MSISHNIGGRLGNQCFSHLAASCFAEKHNLFIEYQNYENIIDLGFDLFVGENSFAKTVEINSDNYQEFYEMNNIDFNVKFLDFFQSNIITKITHSYLHSKKENIISKNKYKDHYNNNNCFIHIRLGDMSHFNPGFKYYNYILSKLQVDNIYVSTDSENHIIIKELIDKYPNILLINPNVSLTDIILFGSTNKYIILSHGTFSGIIGYLGFYSKVFFIKENDKTAWDYCNGNGKFDIFKNKYSMIEQFNEIDIETIIE